MVDAAPVPCSVASADSRDGLATVPTTLTVAGAVSEVSISNVGGFELAWDGRSDCAVDMPVSSYSANITPEEGRRIRRKSFEVTAGSACAFTFDLAAKEWTGGCTE